MSVATLGVPGETLVLSTDCSFTYVLADGSTGSGGCPDPGRQVPTGGEMLDVGWGDDITFTAPDGWQFKDTLVSAADMADVVAGTVAEPGDELIRAGDSPVATLTRTGWTLLGDSVVQLRSTFVKGAESFTATYDVDGPWPDEGAGRWQADGRLWRAGPLGLQSTGRPTVRGPQGIRAGRVRDDRLDRQRHRLADEPTASHSGRGRRRGCP